jgi:hypothetical protein
LPLKVWHDQVAVALEFKTAANLKLPPAHTCHRTVTFLLIPCIRNVPGCRESTSRAVRRQQLSSRRSGIDVPELEKKEWQYSRRMAPQVGLEFA